MKTLRLFVIVTSIACCGAIVPALAKGKPGGSGGGSPPPNPEIALRNFRRNKPEQLLLANADGSNTTLIQTAADKFMRFGDPDMSPVYDEIVYSTWSGANSTAIGTLYLLRYTVGPDSITPGTPLPLAETQGYAIWGDDISPDGKYVLYIAGDSVNGSFVYLRKTDPTSNEGVGSLIYYLPAASGSMVDTDGVCWIYSAFAQTGAYKIAIHVRSSTPGATESQIKVYTIDPTAPTDLTKTTQETTLSTVGMPFTISAAIDCARTTESLLVIGSYRDGSGPVAILWPLDTTKAPVALTDPAVQQNIIGCALSPDDSKLLYYDGSGANILDLSSGVTTKVSSYEPVDWAPPPPPSSP